MFLRRRVAGVGQYEALIPLAASAMSSNKGGGGAGGGGGGSAPPPSMTQEQAQQFKAGVTTQVQVSPQISPVFQQSSGGGSQSASTYQAGSAPQTAYPMDGGSVPYSPDLLAPGGEIGGPAPPLLPFLSQPGGMSKYVPVLVIAGVAVAGLVFFLRKPRHA